MKAIRVLANLAWWWASAPGHQRFRRALRHPAEVQERILARYLRQNAGTQFGQEHGFSNIRSVADYRSQVPVRSYDDYVPYIDRIAQGDTSVLTRSRVRAFAPSSGSTAAAKRIPYTPVLLAEFRRAIAPWVFDMYRRNPRLAFGSSYWSITPVAQRQPRNPSTVPEGFEEDSAYLGGALKRLVDATLAVPGDMRHVQDMDTFRYVSLLFLLKTGDLRFISIWHPTFLLLLLDPLEIHWDSLLTDIAEGSLTHKSPLPPPVEARLRKSLCADPRRGCELGRLSPREYRGIWPRLALISCWTDGHARMHVGGLRRAFPGVEIQAKGLVATEGFVTLPFHGMRPVAVRSHFFEFIGADGKPHLVHELRQGESYSVVLTTGGGLYRYRLGDLVRVAGFVSKTPSLEFLGKEDHIADFFGEKLSAGFVQGVLEDIFGEFRVRPSFAMIGPDSVGGRTCYTLFLEVDEVVPRGLAEALEQRLRDNPHYRYCMSVGQLAPACVFLIAREAYATYVNRCRREGQRVGDIKPSALNTMPGWSQAFEGSYLA